MWSPDSKPPGSKSSALRSTDETSLSPRGRGTAGAKRQQGEGVFYSAPLPDPSPAEGRGTQSCPFGGQLTPPIENGVPQVFSSAFTSRIKSVETIAARQPG